MVLSAFLPAVCYLYILNCNGHVAVQIYCTEEIYQYECLLTVVTRHMPVIAPDHVSSPCAALGLVVGSDFLVYDD